MSRYEVIGVQTRVTFRIMTEFDKGVMSEEFPDWRTGEMHRNDMGELGPHPFSSGFPTPESTQDMVHAAEEYVRSLGTGRVWVERITATTTRERMSRMSTADLLRKAADALDDGRSPADPRENGR